MLTSVGQLSLVIKGWVSGLIGVRISATEISQSLCLEVVAPNIMSFWRIRVEGFLFGKLFYIRKQSAISAHL